MAHCDQCAKYEQRLDAIDKFIPDPEHINALPEAIRNYIHALESRADPAGDPAALIAARENVAALTIRVNELESDCGRMAAFIRDNCGPTESVRIDTSERYFYCAACFKEATDPDKIAHAPDCAWVSLKRGE